MNLGKSFWTYRIAVQELTRVELPARGFSAPIGNMFVWPRAKLLVGSPSGDFEDENPRWDADEGEADIDLRGFPSGDLARVAVVAGPGFGKSTLLQAVAGTLIDTPSLAPKTPTRLVFTPSQLKVRE